MLASPAMELSASATMQQSETSPNSSGRETPADELEALDAVGKNVAQRSVSLQDGLNKQGRSVSLQDGLNKQGRDSMPVLTNLKPASSGGKLLFDMVRFPDHTFSLVPHDDVVYKRIRYSNDSNIYDRMKKVDSEKREGVVAAYGTDMRRTNSLPPVSEAENSGFPPVQMPIDSDEPDDDAVPGSPILDLPPTPSPPQNRNEAIGAVVALFATSAVVRRSKSLDIVPRSAYSKNDYTKSAAHMCTPIALRTSAPEVGLSPIRSKSVEPLGDTSDDDMREPASLVPVLPNREEELVRYYDVNAPSNVVEGTEESKDKSHERVAFTSLLIGSEAIGSDGKEGVATDVQDDADDDAASRASEATNEATDEGAGSEGADETEDEQAAAAYWDQVDNEVHRREDMSPETRRRIAAAAATAAGLGAGMAALDTISYFVDEDGDAFFAPDDQPPRRQYKHTTLGRVKANRPVPRYPSPQNFQQQQAYMPPSVQFPMAMPAGQNQPMMVALPPNMFLMQPNQMAGMTNPNSCNQSMYSFVTTDTARTYMSSQPNMAQQQAPIPMMLIPVQMPPNPDAPQPQAPQLMYMLSPVMTPGSLQQIPENGQDPSLGQDSALAQDPQGDTLSARSSSRRSLSRKLSLKGFLAKKPTLKSNGTPS